MDTESPTMSISITPLTELAVEQASPLLLATSIASANQLVSSLFKFDIVGTQPQALSDFDNLGASQAQKDYGLALAGISQMAADYYQGSITGVLGAMNYDITNNQTLSSATAQQFSTSLSRFLASANNPTGVKDINATNLVNAGGQALTLKLGTTGSLPPGVSICGVQISQLTLPAGVTIRVSDFSNYLADPLVVYPSGVAPTNGNAYGKYTPAAGGQPAYLNYVAAYAGGWSLGEFATVICDLPPGTSYTSGDFKLNQVEVVDGNGAVITEVSVTVTAQ